MKIPVWFCIIILVLLESRGRAQNEDEQIMVSGVGNNREVAIRKALVSAIEQKNGIYIASEGQVASASEDTAKSINDQVNKTAAFSDLFSQKIKATTRGVVSKYAILDESMDEKTGFWTVTLEVYCPVYKPLGLDRSNERSMLILPFRVEGQGKLEATDLIVKGLARKISAQFTQSRKFRVLDRDFDSDLQTELNRAAANSHDAAQLSKLGKQSSADYVLAGTLTLPGAGSSRGELDFRVIEVAPQEIRWADTMPLGFQIHPDGGGLILPEGLLDDTADDVATIVLDVIYPIKVLTRTQSGDIYLNQGGTRSKLNQVFKLYLKAASIHDSDSGLPIRVDGALAGRIQVARSTPKYSVARWIGEAEGNAAIDIEGGVCRRPSREELLAEYKRSVEADIAKQKQMSVSGQCPPLEVSAFRAGKSWGFVIVNNGAKPLNVRQVIKTVLGATDTSPLDISIRPGGKESFNLTERFAAGDRLEFVCQEYEAPYVYYFR